MRANGGILSGVGALGLLVLASCGGGSGTPSPSYYSIGGTVEGLGAGGQVTLALNAEPPLTVTANGAFRFPSTLTAGTGYVVTVTTQPAHQHCLPDSTSASGVTSGSAVIAINCTDLLWTRVTAQADFVGRDGAGALVYDNKMWLIGGWNQNGAFGSSPTTNEVWNSADGLHWNLVKPFTSTGWQPRHMAGWVVFNNMMWVVGGDDNQGHYQGDVWNSSDGVTWNEVTANAPWANLDSTGQAPNGRVLHYVLAFNNKLWVMGGQTLPQLLNPQPQPVPPTTYYSDVWSSPDGINWTKVTDNAPWADPGRGMFCGSVVFDGKMWIIGGGNYWSANPDLAGQGHNDVWSSPDGINWTQVTASAPWPARRYHNIAVFGGRMWVMAGMLNDAPPNDAAVLNDVWSSSDGIDWVQETATGVLAPWLPRHAASLFAFNDALWITGGTPTQPEQLNDVWKLN